MTKMRPPVVPERPVPVLGEDKARALLKACAGSSFVPRRDTAIVRLFLDTGCASGREWPGWSGAGR
jgi:integrase/recombinase XerC